MQTKTVLSGIRATGRLHLGNLYGAIKGFIDLQENAEYKTIYMVMDLHAITTPYDKETLSKNTLSIITDYLALGIDPKKSILAVQSLVPEHTYLSYLFSSVETVARLMHIPTFKEKAKQYPDHITMALVNYPVLMSADILLYRASLVPVGKDQEPHLEIAREIARKINNMYFDGQEYFPIIKRFKTKGEYVPSLTGQGKMSKSVKGSAIFLDDSYEDIKAKVFSIPTDSGSGVIKQDENKDLLFFDKNTNKESIGVKALFSFIKLFLTDTEYEQYKNAYVKDKLMYKDLKQNLADVIFKTLKPYQEKRKKLERDKKYLFKVIQDGVSSCRSIGQETVNTLKKHMGFLDIDI